MLSAAIRDHIAIRLTLGEFGLGVGDSFQQSIALRVSEITAGCSLLQEVYHLSELFLSPLRVFGSIWEN
jgi:hypothetical protein